MKFYYPVVVPTSQSIDDYIAMDNWLWNEIGEEEVDWEWGQQANYVFFYSEEDKVKFILRWL